MKGFHKVLLFWLDSQPADYLPLLYSHPCSFQFSMIGFNPSLTSGFSGYCFLCGNKCGSLSLTTTGIAFCARPTDFPSVHTLGFTFCSIKGREREGSIFMKTEAWTLLSISLPKRGEGDSDTIRNLYENSMESQSQLTEIIPFGSSRQSYYRSRLGRKWARGFSKHGVSYPSILKGNLRITPLPTVVILGDLRCN